MPSDVWRCPVDACETVILGATEADTREHFEEECNPLGKLYSERM